MPDLPNIRPSLPSGVFDQIGRYGYESPITDRAMIHRRAAVAMERARVRTFDRSYLERLLADVNGPSVYDQLVDELGYDPLVKHD